MSPSNFTSYVLLRVPIQRKLFRLALLAAGLAGIVSSADAAASDLAGIASVAAPQTAAPELVTHCFDPLPYQDCTQFCDSEVDCNRCCVIATGRLKVVQKPCGPSCAFGQMLQFNQCITRCYKAFHPGPAVTPNAQDGNNRADAAGIPEQAGPERDDRP